MLLLGKVFPIQRPGFGSAEFPRVLLMERRAPSRGVEKVRHWQRWLAAAGNIPGKRPAGLALA